MRWLRTVAREIYGLFVDDAGFAVAILLWLGALWLMVQHLHTGSSADGWIAGLLLFSGLSVILLESTARYARYKIRK